MKRLILMRHAEAQPAHIVKIDRERALSGAGMKQMDVMGQKLHQKLLGVDYVMCSNAKRARQTFEGIKKHLPATIAISFEDRLYGATAHFIIDRLRRIDDRYENVLIVGHNPALQQFLSAVTEANPFPKPLHFFETCSVAFFESQDYTWFDLHFSSLRLTEQIIPIF